MIVGYNLLVDSKALSIFRKKIKDFHKENKREFPWRETRSPYQILVSEMMLQQTQTSRVVEKYHNFLLCFPTLESLAAAQQKDVLLVWHGLGYNRRALYLKRTAEIITRDYNGHLPKTEKELLQLPGIGKNTAGAILAFAYNIPLPFIETNIRRVFIHEFFKDKKEVSDAELFPLIESSLDRKNPREWYSSLMDYGVYLAKTTENPNRKSRHFKNQPVFKGSTRQARGLIITTLLKGSLSEKALEKEVNSVHFATALTQLIKEGMVKKVNDIILLS